MMNRAQAIKHFEYGISHDVFSEPVTSYARMAVDALREQEQRERNEPLTLEDLRKMHGEPVWIADGKFWALVRVNHDVELIANDHETANAEGWIKHIGPIYRYKLGDAAHE